MATKTIKIIIIGISIALTSLLGYRLRITNYDKIPFPGESQDEYSFSWVGLSLIRTGYPVGISGIRGYSKYDYRYVNVDRIFQGTAGGNPQLINSPWFDHPPVLGLITGGFAYLKGARVFEDTGVFLIRKPMIAAGFLSIILVFLVSLKLYNFLIALIATLIYSTSPLIIISSRMVQAENAIVILLLLSILFVHFYRKTEKRLWLWIANITAGSALLFKLSGVFIILGNSIYLLITSKNKNNCFQEILITITTAFSFLSIFFVYGAIYDFRTFLKILQSNSQRFYGIGANSFYTLITTSKITNLKYLTDGWQLAGWISYMLLLANYCIAKNTKRKLQEHDLLLMSYTTSFLAIYILFGSEHYGWYRIPSYPLLTISLARMIYLSIQKNEHFLMGLLLLLLPTGIGISRIVSIEEFQKYAPCWRWVWFITIILGIILKKDNLQKNHSIVTKIPKIIPIILFLVSIYLNLKELFLINTLSYWYHSI